MRQKKGGKRPAACLEGSYTVEAALVMSAALIFIAALLNGVFDIHSSVVGRMVLQEAVGQDIRLEEGQTEQCVEEDAAKNLRAYFWCGSGKLNLGREWNRAEGTVRSSGESSISVKMFDPESFLRLLTAAGV